MMQLPEESGNNMHELHAIPNHLKSIIWSAIVNHCADRNIPTNNISIEERSIGINCKVFLISIGNSDAQVSRFVIKVFGEIFHMNEAIAQETRTQLLMYQDQLNLHGILLPFTQHQHDFHLHETPSGWIIVSEEQYFGNGANHLDELRLDNMNDQKTAILSDINAIISLQSNDTKTVLGNECALLHTGIDAKPDNFVTHGQTSVYIDLYPPLTLENGKLWTHPALLHPTHPISKEGWEFFVTTIEGAILRYLNSGEFKLKEKSENIRRHYGTVLKFIEPLVSKKSYDLILSEIKERNFAIINSVYTAY